jgi:hypothetical protein
VVVAQQVRDGVLWLLATSLALGRQLLEAAGLGWLTRRNAGGAGGGPLSKRALPGFWRQYKLCLSRVVLMRTREPMKVFTGGWQAASAALGGAQLH